MTDLCLLIPVYNKLQFTQKCLAELKANLDGRLFEWVQVVVIDDGSKDGTSDWINANYPEVVVLKGNGNLFWTGAMNMGLSYAFREKNYEYVMLWNNDVKTADNYFRAVQKFIQSKPHGMVGSKILTLMDHDVVWSFGGYFDPKTGKRGMNGYFQKDGLEYSALREVDWCTGMGTLIHQEVLNTIGLMDQKSFPQYFGDTDYSYRAKLAGFPIVVNPDLILYNDTVNTGLRPQNGFKDLLRSLTDIRSNINMKCNYAFIRKYATSKLAYATITIFYLKVLGGFIKWKLFALFGKHRDSDRFYK